MHVNHLCHLRDPLPPNESMNYSFDKKILWRLWERFHQLKTDITTSLFQSVKDKSATLVTTEIYTMKWCEICIISTNLWDSPTPSRELPPAQQLLLLHFVQFSQEKMKLSIHWAPTVCWLPWAKTSLWLLWLTQVWQLCSNPQAPTYIKEWRSPLRSDRIYIMS